jgi:hypothetical protein
VRVKRRLEASVSAVEYKARFAVMMGARVE